MRASVICVLLVSFAIIAPAQQACPLPPILQRPSSGQDIFTDQQESALGDILADALVEDEAVIQDDPLNAHLRQVGSTLLRYLPDNSFRVQFSLIELPEANAFSLPGGRVYISRKLIASLKSDDELAAIMAHELGHIITHQGAIEMTDTFRQVLGVNSVSDRNDIEAKIHRVRDTWAMHKIKLRDTDQPDQLMADKVALYAMARAGFKLQAFADALDRTADLHGKTGNWVSDLFHTTKPEQKRLREAIRSTATVPPACIATPAQAADSEFGNWQLQVIAYKQPAGREQLTGVVLREKLAQPLRPNIYNLRYSPDGKNILAQDEGGIHVLTRDPFKELFFIDASSAYKAHFTPDSKSIVFYTPELRIETWDIASQHRVMVREMVLKTTCIQTALSPDGKSLACYDTDATLWLFDTATGEPILQRKGFFHPTRFGLLLIDMAEGIAQQSDSDNSELFVDLGFSPDGRYFLAGGNALASEDVKTCVYDLFEKHDISVGRGVHDALNGPFVFIGDDRVATISPQLPQKSPIVQFPSGKKVGELAFGSAVELLGSTTGDYILAGPLKDAALSLIDVKTKNSVARVKYDAGDVYNGTILAEELDGTLAMVDLSSKKLTGSLSLKDSRLSSSRGIAVSPDFKWLAVSTKTRGAMWDLITNVRTHSLRAFHGGWFADDHSFYADFPKSGDDKRTIVKLDPSPYSPHATKAYEVGEQRAQQLGRYLLVTVRDSKKPGDRNVTFDLRDYIANTTFWSRKFPHQRPSGSWDTGLNKVLFWWGTWEAGAKDELQQFPEYKSQTEDKDYFFEVVDLKTNATAARMLLKTNRGSFQIRDASFDGDWLVLTTRDGRVLVYSMASGKEVGDVFGYAPIFSASADVMVTPLSDTILNVYTLSTADFRERLKFATPVIFRAFSMEGKRLFVLTSDQTAYIFDLSAISASQPKLAMQGAGQ